MYSLNFPRTWDGQHPHKYTHKTRNWPHVLKKKPQETLPGSVRLPNSHWPLGAQTREPTIYDVSGIAAQSCLALFFTLLEIQHGSCGGKKGYCPAWLQLQDEYEGDGQGAAQPLGSPVLPDMRGASVHGCVITQSRFLYFSLLSLYNKGQAWLQTHSNSEGGEKGIILKGCRVKRV